MNTPLFQQTTPLGRRVRRLSSAFLPSSLSGLALWLDASDATTFTTSSGLVTQWRDKSGNVNHAAQSGAARPAYNAHTINALPTVTFDASSTYLNLSSAISDNGVTLFAVASFNGLSSTGPFIGVPSGFGDTYFGIYGSINTYFIYNDAGNNASTTLARSATAKNYCATTGLNNLSLFVDGTSLVSGASGAFSSNYSQIGARVVGSEHLDGNLGEFLLYNRVLTTPERGQVNAYIRSKWGTA